MNMSLEQEVSNERLRLSEYARQHGEKVALDLAADEVVKLRRQLRDHALSRWDWSWDESRQVNWWGNSLEEIETNLRTEWPIDWGEVDFQRSGDRLEVVRTDSGECVFWIRDLWAQALTATLQNPNERLEVG